MNSDELFRGEVRPPVAGGRRDGREWWNATTSASVEQCCWLVGSVRFGSEADQYFGSSTHCGGAGGRSCCDGKSRAVAHASARTVRPSPLNSTGQSALLIVCILTAPDEHCSCCNIEKLFHHHVVSPGSTTAPGFFLPYKLVRNFPPTLLAPPALW